MLSVRPETTRMEESNQHRSLLLDSLIVAVAVGLLVAISKFGLEAGHPATRGAGSIFGGIYFLYLGVLFLLADFFPQRCFVFSFLRYVSRDRVVLLCIGGFLWFAFAIDRIGSAMSTRSPNKCMHRTPR
jgi:hypothetical protein